ITRRVRSQIDNHVKDRPARASHELAFSMRRRLVVKPAQGAALGIEGDARLRHLRIQTPLCEFAPAERAREKTPFVVEPFGGDHECSGHGRLLEFHLPTDSSCARLNRSESSAREQAK